MQNSELTPLNSKYHQGVCEFPLKNNVSCKRKTALFQQQTFLWLRWSCRYGHFWALFLQLHRKENVRMQLKGEMKWGSVLCRCSQVKVSCNKSFFPSCTATLLITFYIGHSLPLINYNLGHFVLSVWVNQCRHSSKYNASVPLNYLK